MKVCKYAGDVNDEYCKNCDGIIMEVEGKEISCTECAGYEAGDTEVDTDTGEVTEEPMNPPVEAVEESKKEDKPKATQKANTATEPKQVTNTTAKTKTAVNEASNNVEKANKDVVKVAEEKQVEETTNGVKITSIRYTSGATIKKGDNYFKFIAEEEWDVSQTKQDIQDVREQLWAKLNAEVDAQIEELNSMN